MKVIQISTTPFYTKMYNKVKWKQARLGVSARITPVNRNKIKY